MHISDVDFEDGEAGAKSGSNPNPNPNPNDSKDTLKDI